MAREQLVSYTTKGVDRATDFPLSRHDVVGNTKDKAAPKQQLLLLASQISPYLSVVNYLVRVQLQIPSSRINVQSKGTIHGLAEPRITIYGQYGDTGVRPIRLYVEPSGITDDNNQFVEGLIEAVYLGQLTSLMLSPVQGTSENKHIQTSHQDPSFGVLCIDITIRDPISHIIYTFLANE
ncbi:unnamed protein product [Protopolystoma xenopodis]|uniref:Uncharacterized protein n=1 Tax=Protopolystoma xenopodis TaxID=117903 RepID=A0A448WP88_9PLAT|nr:unnamed protein product [Protopolystoma xenopodis]